jgi:two-component system OmpR family sensor kinase
MTHTPSGTTVTLHARRQGARAEVAVEDDGPGIPTAQREAVFGRFYRVDGGMASGSGLGLAIAREIARLMGGEVRLDSTSGPTVFTLDLPGEPVPPGAQRGLPVFSRENTVAEPEHVSRNS